MEMNMWCSYSLTVLACCNLSAMEMTRVSCGKGPGTSGLYLWSLNETDDTSGFVYLREKYTLVRHLHSAD